MSDQSPGHGGRRTGYAVIALTVFAAGLAVAAPAGGISQYPFASLRPDHAFPGGTIRVDGYGCDPAQYDHGQIRLYSQTERHRISESYPTRQWGEWGGSLLIPPTRPPARTPVR